MAYPVLMFKLLPTGILGIMVTGMAAAFMSTIDTHITWGSSYLVKDFYQRLWKPDATEKELVRAGRIGILLITVIALAVTTQINSISDAWKFITAMGSGIGLVSILRWFWWRINAISELVGLISAAVLSLVLYGFFDAQEMPYHITLLIVVGVSTTAMLIATFMTAPSSEEHLKKFCAKIKPVGFWAKYRSVENQKVEPGFWVIFRSWLVASVGLFALLFGIGEVLLGITWFGWNGIVVGAACWIIALRWVKALPLKTVASVPQVGK
jgi:SSS family solute:Na+ symporter